jgi:cytochrome P450
VATPVTTSHLLIHRSPEKRCFYEQASPVFWSDSLECWVASGKDIILQILKDRDFHAVNYRAETARLSQRLGVDQQATEELLDFVPLGLEGSQHAAVRKRMAISIREMSANALDGFSDLARSRIAVAFDRPRTFDIVAEIFSPAVVRLMSTLGQLPVTFGNHAVSPTQIFDKTLSVNRRKAINRQISELLTLARSACPMGEGALNAAMVVVGSDSLLGSIAESFVREIRRNPGVPLGEIAWSDKIPVTAVPYVERIAATDCRVGDVDIEAGQRIRLYLDALEADGPDGHDFYFGSGRHVCLGKAISTQAWKILTSAFAEIRKRVEIEDVRYRRSDFLFNAPQSVEVRVHDD